MKIIVTGSLGNISRPLTTELVGKKHQVVVVSSKQERKAEIEALGATAAIGSMRDARFLTNTFKGADIVYAMESLGHNFFFDQSMSIHDAISEIARNYEQAISASGVKKVVHLSSVGAHTNKGVGMLSFHYDAEKIFNELPQDVSIKFLRPVGFYYNMYAFIPAMKSRNAIFANYGGDNKEPWVSPLDIASVISEEMEKPFRGRTIRYIASEELSPNEVARILGESVGKPDMKWVRISDEQALKGLLDAGFNPQVAEGMVAMNASRNGGVLYEDYFLHKPVLGKTKLKDFVKDFAAAYARQ